MPKASILLILIAVILGFSRLYTGIIASCDSAELYYVSKNYPDFFIEKKEECPDEIHNYIHTLGEENGLIFSEEYILLMKATPVAMPLLLIGAFAWFVPHQLRG
jgi:hypothetical protein